MDEQELLEYIQNHIKKINEKISDFKTSTPNDTQIKDFLRKKFISELPEIKEQLITSFREKQYVKARIKDIASEFILYSTDVENFLINNLYGESLKKVDDDKLIEAIANTVENTLDDKHEYRFIKNNLNNISKKLITLLKLNGFSSNILNINSGVMLANSGDSAQFLFLSRAILAGFNASNVDVRSSRYDAIVDYNSHLLRIQIKGISSNSISFKDRDRGGQGIDHTHERNRGKIITSQDCDIYVAVDKQVGICYLIPMASYVDKLDDETKEKPINISTLQQYKENWEIIKEVAESKNE